MKSAALFKPDVKKFRRKKTHRNRSKSLNSKPVKYTMRTFLSFLKFLFMLALLLLAVALFLPSESHIERSIVIKQPPEIPYNLVNRLQNWKLWSPWHRMDPEMKIIYSGPPEGVGATYSWKSKHREVGDGEQKVVSAKPYEYILMDMAFAEGGPARCGFYFQKTAAGTEIKWTIDSDAGWNLPGRYFMLLMDYFVGPQFEQGLSSLSALSAKVAAQGFTMGFELTEFPGMEVIGMRNSAAEKEISSALGLTFQTTIGMLPALNLQMTGAPIAIYEPPSGGIFRFFAGFPVNAKPEGTLPAGLENLTIPPGKTLLCRFNGPYNKIAAAYKQIQEEMKTRNLELAGSPWESYITDPASVKNPLEIRTDLFWPVR